MKKEETGPLSPNQPNHQENKEEQVFKVSLSGKFEDLVRNALEILDQDDPDGARVRNGAGFNKKHGEPARILLEKDDWDDEDLTEAYNIAKYYKNTQLKEQWKEITQAQKERKKAEYMPDGIWNPIEFVNEDPVAYVGWYEGKPHKLRVVESAKDTNYVLQKITLRNYDDREIQNRIKRLKINGMDMVEFNEEIFTKNDFVNLMVFPSYCNLFTECVNALPIDDTEYKEPKFYKEDGYIKFPEKFYARRDDSYQRMLKDALNIGPVNPEIYNEAISLMSKHSKQLTLHYAIIGANVVNVLGIEDYLNTIDAIGESDSGKSFAVDVTLQLCYGIGNSKLQDDAMSSGFRHHNIAGSTNLPIHVEEAMMDERSLKRLKSTGKNVRGNSDKSLTVYRVEVTLIFSRNSESKDMKNVDPNEQKAINKRVHKFLFLQDDVIKDNQEKINGSKFIQKIKEMPGGLLYEKLKQKPIREIIKKYHELKAVETRPELVIAKLGAWIMDNTDFNPVVTEIQPPSILDEFFGKILDTWYRLNSSYEVLNGQEVKFTGTQQDNQMRNNLFIDEDKKEFIVTANGFGEIKRLFGYTGSAESFAKSYGFEYKNVKKSFIGGFARKCIVGKIPDEYFQDKTSGKKTQDSKPENKESEPKTENKEAEQDKEPAQDDESETDDELTPEEKKNLDLDKILG